MKCRNAEDFMRVTSSGEFAFSQFRSLYFSAPRIISSAHRVRNWSLYGTPSATRRSNRAFPLSVSRTIPEANSARSPRSEEHTSELQSRENLVCRLLLEKKKKIIHEMHNL